MRKIICLILLILLITTTVVITACESGKTNIKSDTEAKQTVTGLTNDLSNLSTSLDSINKQLG